MVFGMVVTGILYTRQQGDTDVKNRLLNHVEEGEGGMIQDNGIEICISPYVKQLTSTTSMREVGHCSGTIQRDGVGKEVERVSR